MASSGSKKYHWTDVQLYALGLAGQNASNQDKTTDVQLGMEIANTYKLHLQRALVAMMEHPRRRTAVARSWHDEATAARKGQLHAGEK